MAYTFLLTHGLEQSAANYPERAAFKCGDASIKYCDLLNQVNHVAHELISRGVSKGDRVGVLMNRCLETSIAIYGILQAGALYVPIDPKAPESRMKFQVSDCDIKIILTVKKQRKKAEKLSTLIIEVENKQLSKDVYFRRDFPLLADDPAYILYTSGSTGIPKGIVHSHRSGLAYAKLTKETFQITEKDVLANHAPIFFDISTLGYFTGPLSGACTVILSDAHTIMPGSLVQVLEDEQVSIWYSVPRAIQQMVSTGQLTNLNLKAMRWMLYAGEAFPTKHLREAMMAIPEAKFCNIYGPTETNQCTHYILPKVPEENEVIPIGMVWENTEYVIKDGELLIRSATNMMGYWNNATLTSKSFYRINGNQYYCTGDLVEKGEDGLLYLKGRKDHQVKIRGFRVELGEIEKILLRFDAVEEAAVVTRKEQDLHKDIVAFIKVKNASDDKEWMKLLRAELPHYAIPTEFYTLEDFPRTPNGKLDRKKLEWRIKS